MDIAKEILVGVAILICAGFIGLQFKNFKEWLIWAVCEAEAYLGSGTGQLKLEYVYNLAVTRFPWLTKIITFGMFSKFVDCALEKMKKMIEENEAIEKILTDVSEVIDVKDEEEEKSE